MCHNHIEKLTAFRPVCQQNFKVLRTLSPPAGRPFQRRRILAHPWAQGLLAPDGLTSSRRSRSVFSVFVAAPVLSRERQRVSRQPLCRLSIQFAAAVVPPDVPVLVSPPSCAVKARKTSSSGPEEPLFRRSSSGVPAAIRRPRSSIPIRSAISSATLNWWVEIMMVAPALDRSLRISFTTRA